MFYPLNLISAVNGIIEMSKMSTETLVSDAIASTQMSTEQLNTQIQRANVELDEQEARNTRNTLIRYGVVALLLAILFLSLR